MSLSRSQMLSLIQTAADSSVSLESVTKLSDDDQAFAEKLGNEYGQAHILAAWPPAGVEDEQKAACLAQCRQLDASYPGGIAAYVASARKLLGQSQRGENPLGGWAPSVPEDGFDLAPGSEAYEKYERAGLAQAGKLGYVVPAGGLGERLGYHGVKFALPSEISSGASVLRVYADYMLAAQRASEEGGAAGVVADEAATSPSSRSPPLAIMVSDDTESGIRAMLEANKYFGLGKANVTLLKQEKVAALADASAKFAMVSKYEIATKPHGHGDIHFLLHSSGTCKRWHDELGVRWLHFFQDTNTLYFCNFLATLGVSATHQVAVNLVASPRRAKEAVGAVVKLTHTDGRTMVANVEYNQLEPMLLSSGFTEGDVNEADGWSRFPGNINQILISLPSWLEAVATSNGAIDEFINPKYTDATRTAFKSATRLECMMQDYVKTVPTSHKVAWTRYPTWLGYFPCKNDIVSAAKLSASGVPPHSASTSEMAVYHFHAQSLRTLGATIAEPATKTFRGVSVDVGPAIVLAPSFAPCFTTLQSKVPSAANISVSARSTLLVSGANVIIEGLTLDGTLVIDVADGGSLRIVSLEVSNAGWEFTELNDKGAAAADEPIAIRGYNLKKHAQRIIKVAAGEDIVIEQGKARKSSLAAVDLESSMRRANKKKSGSSDDDIKIVVRVESPSEKKEGGCCCVLS